MLKKNVKNLKGISVPLLYFKPKTRLASSIEDVQTRERELSTKTDLNSYKRLLCILHRFSKKKNFSLKTASYKCKTQIILALEITLYS